MTTSHRNSAEYKAMKQELKAYDIPCTWCGKARATEPDHEPPIAAFPPGEWEGELLPSCMPCNRKRSAKRTNRIRRLNNKHKPIQDAKPLGRTLPSRF